MQLENFGWSLGLAEPSYQSDGIWMTRSTPLLWLGDDSGGHVTTYSVAHHPFRQIPQTQC